jgi:hypothetical protein
MTGLEVLAGLVFLFSIGAFCGKYNIKPPKPSFAAALEAQRAADAKGK